MKRWANMYGVRFFIRMISTKTLVEVQDLTPFIATSPFQIDPNELDSIINEAVPDSHYNEAGTFGYEIGTETQQQEKQG